MLRMWPERLRWQRFLQRQCLGRFVHGSEHGLLIAVPPPEEAVVVAVRRRSSSGHGGEAITCDGTATSINVQLPNAAL